MRHSRKLGAAQQQSFTALHSRPAGIQTLLQGLTGLLVRRRSKRSMRFAWYARSKVDGKTVERFVADENGLSREQVAAMRAVTGADRRRATAVSRLVKAGFAAPPARIAAMLEALAPALGGLVLVDDWAPMLYEGLTGYRGCAFEEPLVYPPLSFVLGVGQSIEELVDLLELDGGDWFATPQNLRGVTRLTGPLGEIELYDRDIGAPAAWIGANAGTGVMLTGQGLNMKVLSPLDQVFWDAWRASKNGADAGLRRARAASLAPWAAEVDTRRQAVLQLWMGFVPGIVRTAIRSFAAPTRLALVPLVLPSASLPERRADPEQAPDGAAPTESVAAAPVPETWRELRVEWRKIDHAAFTAFKLDIEMGRDRINLGLAQFRAALAAAKVATPLDPAQIAYIEREIAELELQERHCTLALSRKCAQIDAAARAATLKANARAAKKLKPLAGRKPEEVIPF
jgi:hypothetical protein